MEILDRDGRQKVALVTGVGSRKGLGFEVASQLARLGFRVLITSRNEGAAHARAEELRGEGYDVEGHLLNSSDAEDVRALARRLWEEGQLDVVVNNPDRVPILGGSVASADLLIAREAMEVVLFETWRVTQCVLPFLLTSPHPRIVNVASGVGSHDDIELEPQGSARPDAGYIAAKAALNVLTVSLAEELRQLGVLVNAVCTSATLATDAAERRGCRAIEDVALGVVWAATLSDDGPSGGLFRDGAKVPW